MQPPDGQFGGSRPDCIRYWKSISNLICALLGTLLALDCLD